MISRSHKYLLFISLAIFLQGEALAQISPGPLSKAHAELEGMSNCTQCHTLGSKVSNDKCLSCHKEIKSRLSANKGLHASPSYKSKDCFTCHSEHHGRNFEMIRFDKKTFDHNLTGYTLSGKHKVTDCRECHKKENVSESGLAKRPVTYLGLNQNCASCHEDSHQQTLGNKCQDCHNTDAFVPATLFRHEKTDFPLVGKHTEVSCVECHPKDTKNNQPFQKFADVSFVNCNSCHDDPHQRRVMNDCKQCHTESSFRNTHQMDHFSHQKTGFQLKGRHAKTDCFSCHVPDKQASSIFSDKNGVAQNDCIACHEDPHISKFGTQCVDCHNESSFKDISNLSSFNHSLTGFQLLGKHQFVDCRECHVADLTDPLPHQTCVSCHDDYHNGEFTKNGITPDCAQCHNEDGFETSLYSIEDHKKTKFPLDGAHLATPCFACHLEGEAWRFRIESARCTDCHENIHGETIPEKYFPDNNCTTCHQTSSWQESLFDHDVTKFKLLGKHQQVRCDECHLKKLASNERKFVDLSQNCHECHEDNHQGQFGNPEVLDCLRCHDMNSWLIDSFDHDQTRFKLDGKHALVSCEKCHFVNADAEKPYVVYKTGKIECIDCHL